MIKIKNKILFVFGILLMFLLFNSINVRAAEKYDYIIVGDSRTLGIYDAYTGNYTMNSVNKLIQINGKNVKILAVSGIGYDYWFTQSSHYSQITSSLTDLKKDGSCFIWLGINGNITNAYATKYVNSLDKLARSNPNKNIYFCSVTGIYQQEYDKYYKYSINNNAITNFNNNVRSGINGKNCSNLRFKDVANTSVKIGSNTQTVNNWVVNSNKYATDGLHYLGENRILYKAIWEQAMTNNNLEQSEPTSGVSTSGGRLSSSVGSGVDYSFSVSADSVAGEDREVYAFTDVFSNTDYYSDIDDIDSDSKEKVEKNTGKILGVITNIGIVLSILMPALIGIKYMIFGNMEPRKDIVPYIVGATILFSICILTKIIYIIGKGISSI